MFEFLVIVVVIVVAVVVNFLIGFIANTHTLTLWLFTVADTFVSFVFNCKPQPVLGLANAFEPYIWANILRNNRETHTLTVTPTHLKR